MDDQVRAGLRKLLEQSGKREKWGNSEQAAYVFVKNPKAGRARTRGTLIATKGKRDGLEVEVWLREASGEFYRPLTISVEQAEGATQLRIGGEIVYVTTAS